MNVSHLFYGLNVMSQRLRAAKFARRQLMDQSHRPGRWVQIFLLVSLICGVSQICSLAQNATQPENAASEASTQPASAASGTSTQASSSETIPDISGVWATPESNTPPNQIITHAPVGSS